MDNSKLKSGNGPASKPAPNQPAAKAGAACVRPSMPKGNTGSQSPKPLKSGNTGG